jgi:hypothetical protein
MTLSLHSRYSTSDKFSGLPGKGLSGFTIQTAHGQLFVKIDTSLGDDDICVVDMAGEKISYRETHINEQIEKILLKEDSL